MAKRFISTEIFDDEWFCTISKDAKLFFIYYITKCDHAGVLRFNKRLFEFQTGIRNFDTLIKEFDNCIIRVKEQLFFMPKFIKFQYPDFPKSNVRQQDSAIKILKELNLWDHEKNTYLTVIKELPNSYGNDIGNDIGNVTNNTWKENFEIYKNELREKYNEIISDKNYISERERYHPGLDIKKTIEKACVDFWATEAGWKNKKSSRSKEIDWKITFNNSLSQKLNQVWKEREDRV